MPGRLPVASDFPPSIELTITPPSPSPPRYTNVLVLLHGLGDTLDPFTQLGKQMSLPETTCISLRAATPMPFELGGFHWGDDIIFSQSRGDLRMDMDTGFSKSSKNVMQAIIQEGLIEKCGYAPREIMLFGLGQGGMAAMAAASSTSDELAGVVSIGGPFPLSAKSAAKLAMTPVLLLGGSSNTAVTRQRVDDSKAIFKSTEYHKWNKSGDGMPTNRSEMLPIMRFFAYRLKSRSGVPQGSLEVS